MRKKDVEAADKTIIIKKYANRRLYNTGSSSYVTLDDLAEMVRNEVDFTVVDAKSGEDLTHGVLTQIILEQESRGQNLLPVNFLRQLIRFYGDSLENFVPNYLEMSMATLAEEQSRYRKQLESAMAGSPLEAFQAQTQRNFELFERTFAMMTPFGKPGEHGATGDAPQADSGAAAPSTANAQPSATTPSAASPRARAKSEQAPASGSTGQPTEIDELKDQLARIQAQLNDLAK
ncbi:MAG: polyhydroxyalkanoate synthesis repressor PhaR [Pseudomonadota bacterium]